MKKATYHMQNANLKVMKNHTPQIYKTDSDPTTIMKNKIYF